MQTEMRERICPRCGSGDWEDGALKTDMDVSGSSLFFRLAKTPFLSWISTRVTVGAAICMDCGLIEMTGDLERARKVLNR